MNISFWCTKRNCVNIFIGPMAAKDIDTSSDHTKFGPNTIAKFCAFILFRSDLSVTCKKIYNDAN